jgi:ABC-2 type transport system ATP-binding protein
MTTALAVRGLTKRYGEVAAVDDLHLAIAPGQVYGFLGPNGAGKTTTIRMLLGLVRPTAGEVEVLGEAVRPGAGVRALLRVGALVEEPAFYGYLSGARNLDLFASAAPDGRAARRGRVGEVLDVVGLRDAADKKVKAYSQGMRQRLGIARALLGDPDLLVLDEPTNGLDPQGIAAMRVLLRGLAAEGRTVVVSSHLLAEVEAACDRVAVIARGRLVAEGEPRALRPAGDRLAITAGDPAAAREVLRRLDGVDLLDDPAGGALVVRLTGATAPAEVNAALVRAGIAVSALTPLEERLEDAFLDLTAEPGGADAPR